MQDLISSNHIFLMIYVFNLILRWKLLSAFVRSKSNCTAFVLALFKTGPKLTQRKAPSILLVQSNKDEDIFVAQRGMCSQSRYVTCNYTRFSLNSDTKVSLMNKTHKELPSCPFPIVTLKCHT